MTAPQKTQEEIDAETAAAAQEAAAKKAKDAADAAAAEGTEGEEQLGDKGKQALDRMKAERSELKEQLKAYRDLGLDPDKLKSLISQSEESQKAAEQERVRREAETSALSKANERLIRSEVKLAATGKLADPKHAAELLKSLAGVDLSTFDVNDDGDVDSDAIAAAVDQMIKDHPYLAAQGDQKRFNGTGDSGHRGSAGKPQLTKQDVERLAAQGKHAEIEAARKDGRLNTLLNIQ